MVDVSRPVDSPKGTEMLPFVLRILIALAIGVPIALASNMNGVSQFIMYIGLNCMMFYSEVDWD